MTPPAPGLCRRSLIAIAAGMAGAGIGACSPKPTPSNVPLRRRTPEALADAALLDSLLGLERHAIAAYSVAVPLLSPAASRAARQFLAQELAHAGEIEGLIAQAGARPSRPPAFYDLGSPQGETALLALLHRAETAQLAGYLDAIPRLSPSRLRAAAAAILANHAQHAAVLRGRLGLAAVPGALVGAGE